MASPQTLSFLNLLSIWLCELHLLENWLPSKDFPNFMPKSIGSPSLLSSAHHLNIEDPHVTILYFLFFHWHSSLLPLIYTLGFNCHEYTEFLAINLYHPPWLFFPDVFVYFQLMAQRFLNKIHPKPNSFYLSLPVQPLSFLGKWCWHLPSSVGSEDLWSYLDSSLFELKVLVSASNITPAFIPMSSPPCPSWAFHHVMRLT